MNFNMYCPLAEPSLIKIGPELNLSYIHVHVLNTISDHVNFDLKRVAYFLTDSLALYKCYSAYRGVTKFSNG